MTTDQPEDWRRRAERAVRITVGVEKVSQEWRSYLALVTAAPDEATLRRWTCERFSVDEEVAAALLPATQDTHQTTTRPSLTKATTVRGSPIDD